MKRFLSILMAICLMATFMLVCPVQIQAEEVSNEGATGTVTDDTTTGDTTTVDTTTGDTTTGDTTTGDTTTGDTTTGDTTTGDTTTGDTTTGDTTTGDTTTGDTTAETDADDILNIFSWFDNGLPAPVATLLNAWDNLCEAIIRFVASVKNIIMIFVPTSG